MATLLACWGAGILLLKYRAVKTQLNYAEQKWELLPLEIGLQITATNVSQLLSSISEQVGAASASHLETEAHVRQQLQKFADAARELEKRVPQQAGRLDGNDPPDQMSRKAQLEETVIDPTTEDDKDPSRNE